MGTARLYDGEIFNMPLDYGNPLFLCTGCCRLTLELVIGSPRVDWSRLAKLRPSMVRLNLGGDELKEIHGYSGVRSIEPQIQEQKLFRVSYLILVMQLEMQRQMRWHFSSLHLRPN